MSFAKEEVDLAIKYIEDLEITAMLDPDDGQTLVFGLNSPLPDDLSIDVSEIVEICVECHKQAVFTGEYHMVYEDGAPPDPGTNDVLSEINFYLKYYKKYLMKELLKGLDVYEDPEGESKDEPEVKRKMSPFAEVMMSQKSATKEDEKKD